MVRLIGCLSCRSMTREGRERIAEGLARRVQRVVPESIDVLPTADAMRDLVTIELHAGRLHRHKRVLTAACMAVADAPAGLMVRVEWR